MNTAIVKVWDLPIRLFHWFLVASFFIAYFTEDDLLTVHVWAGYTVFGLLLFRLVWGFIGNPYARFNNFLCKPTTAFAYVKDVIALRAKRYLGHNPAGAAMIAMLSVCLLLTTLSGFAVYGADQSAGPLAFIGPDHEEFWEDAHELFANLSVLLVVVHITGVAAESFIHKENLARAMIHGNKRALNDEPSPRD